MTENLPDTNVGNIEYISKQDAIDIASEDGKKIPTLAIRIMHDIKGLQPAADVAPVVHGRWKYKGVCGIKNDIAFRRYKCSECREDIVCDYPYNFCPNCGAKMDGKREE